jgi:hypothetical protein
MFTTKLAFTFMALLMVSTGCAANNQATSKAAMTATAREIEARDTLNSILFDQQTYYISNQAFTTSLKDLETMKTSLESPSYKYAIKPKPDKQTGVLVTATPKLPNLRSFTGVVFALNSGKERLTVTEICATAKPSNRAPAAPAIPRSARDMIRCPAGSDSSVTMLALQ